MYKSRRAIISLSGWVFATGRFHVYRLALLLLGGNGYAKELRKRYRCAGVLVLSHEFTAVAIDVTQ